MKSSTKTLLITLAVIGGLVALVSLAGGGGAGAFVIGVLFFLGGVVYLLPSILALEREHDNSTAIIALNVLLGWLLLPWVGAIIWALSRNRAVELIEASARPTSAQSHVQPTYAAGLATSAMPVDERACPFCAETVKAAAKICKHCHSDLSQAT